MPVCVTSAFNEPEGFEAALRKGGCLGLLITGCGQFRAQLTVVELNCLRISAAEERLSRIAFTAVPTDMVITTFSMGDGPEPVCGGVRMRPGELMILPPGEHVHARTDGPRRWGSIWIPVEQLMRYSSALTGEPFVLHPGPQCWRPSSAAGRHLRSLHAAAIRMAQTRPQAFADRQTAYGLEQQLIEALVECLSAGSADRGTRSAQRGRDIMARFENLIQDQPYSALHAIEICAVLGISQTLLRDLCTEHLGTSPINYVRLRRMSLVRRALQRGGREAETVMAVAARYGFRNPGRFAANYRTLFNELPSTTFRAGSGQQFRSGGTHK